GQPAGEKRVLLLLDTSASMRRPGMWDAAREKARAAIEKLDPGDECALFLFDREVHPLFTFDDWKRISPAERSVMAVARIDGVKPGWGSTTLDAALVHAAEAIEEPGESRESHHEIVLISDLAEGSRIDSLQGYDWPPGLHVTVDIVRPQNPDNAAPQWMTGIEESDPDQAKLRLRVTNASDSKREQFKLQWTVTQPAGNGSLDLQVPPGQTRAIHPDIELSQTPLQVVLTGDQADFDNTIHVLAPRSADIPVLFIGTDKEDDPQGLLYYLKRGLHKTALRNIEILPDREMQTMPSAQLSATQLIVIGNGASREALASARQVALAGKIVLVPLTGAGESEAFRILFPDKDFLLTEARVADYALLSDIDFQHPLFAAFADPRFSDFTKIHFWKHRRLAGKGLADARIVARFDDRDPAIVQVPLGKGSVVLLASSWRPIDSQLALSSKFVPMLHALLDESSDLPAQKAQYFVGEEVAMPPANESNAAWSVRKPDGAVISATRGERFAGVDQPGVYQVEPRGWQFVANVAPEESRTAPLPLDRLGTLGVPLTGRTVPRVAALGNGKLHPDVANLEARQKLWRWLIVAAIAVGLLETLIAWRVSQRALAVPVEP
ncbi:MAG TPA: VWA domain-containing protein, partial [Chthoniobacteraceae bacterium]|nr:VWA domain-containing protein [Chthoniobacteraceae bacterium]